MPFATALLLSAGLSASARAGNPQAGGGQDAHPALPAGDGRDVMIRVCSKCHDPELAADQQFDEAGWKALVDQMASKGAEATEDEFAQIVRYLTKAFPIQ
ncbi:MAG: cytochrome c [Vicinamibacterales bacterium]